MLYCDHVGEDGQGLFRLACDHALGRVVAKRTADPCSSEKSGWLKIRNPRYIQWIGGQQCFERETEPSFYHWNSCVPARESLG
jgi:hypothetical protein